MFGITFEDPEKPGQKLFAWQNSWGLSTRSIGAVVMIHGDNRGLVLPPRVAAIQIIVVPVGITAKTTDEERQKLIDATRSVSDQLVNEGHLRAETDLRENMSPGAKFNHWELRGVPVRLEVGPKELESRQILACIRYSGEKRSIPLASLITGIAELLDEIHDGMYRKIETARDNHKKVCLGWQEFNTLLDEKNIILSPFCGGGDCETTIKNKSVREKTADEEQGISLMGAKTLCIPLEQPDVELPKNCIDPECKEQAKYCALFGRSY